MNCKNCGAKLDAGALFCRKCGTAVPQEPAPEPKKSLLTKLKESKLFRNPRLLIAAGAALLLLLVLVIVIVSVASCGASGRLRSPDDVREAVLGALEKGDGEALYRLTKLSESVLGAHPETFGAGDTPEAVMRGYYDRLAKDLVSRLTEQYGKGFALGSETETKLLSGSEIFEPNRALGIEASQYAEITGRLTVGDETVGSIRIVAAELNGEWKLLVVYVY